jgi:hypothetical protein
MGPSLTRPKISDRAEKARGWKSANRTDSSRGELNELATQKLRTGAGRGSLHRLVRPHVVLSTSLAFEPVTKGNGFQFDPNGVLDRNHRACLEYECR